MLKELRLAVMRQWEDLSPERKPALRRSDAPGYLLATDAPKVLSATDTDVFAARLTALGWQMDRKGDWLWLDAPVPVPEEVPDAWTGETGCCVSILRRAESHQQAPCDEETREWIRLIVKAAEKGGDALHRTAGELHGCLAEKLRLKSPLPTLLIPYLNAAAKEANLSC